MWMIVGTALLLLSAAYVSFRPNKTRLQPESLWIVEFDDVGVTVKHPQGELQAAKWNEITKVAIRTTDEGPWDIDLFWGLHTKGTPDPAAVFPGGASGEEAFMKELEARLVGVRSDQIIKAMGSTSNAYFVVWESGTSQASTTGTPA